MSYERVLGNIYTIDTNPSEPGKPKQVAPQVYGSLRPAHKQDLVLVQELPYAFSRAVARAGQ